MPRAIDFRECLDCACFAVRRAARAVTQDYDRALRPSGLRATQFSLLSVLAIGGRTGVSRLADRLGTERTTVTRNLRPLLKRGLVAVHPAADGRVREVALTAAGFAALSAALPHWRRVQRAMRRRLAPPVLETLGALAARG